MAAHHCENDMTHNGSFQLSSNEYIVNLRNKISLRGSVGQDYILEQNDLLHMIQIKSAIHLTKERMEDKNRTSTKIT